MTVGLIDGAITLEGACLLEDVEPLLALLVAHPSAPIDLRRCVRLHLAGAQLLLASRSTISHPAEEPFLARWLMPLLL